MRHQPPNSGIAGRRPLLSDLYHRGLHELRRGGEKPILAAERVKDTRREALALLLERDTREQDVLTLWRTLNNDYFLRHHPDEIAWHSGAILRHRQPDKPLVAVKGNSSRGGSLIFVYTRDQKNLFASITRAIEKLGLNVVDARIITNRKGYALDTFIVLENDGRPGLRPDNAAPRSRAASRNTSGFPGSIQTRKTGSKKRRLKSFTLPTRVSFTSDLKNNRTIMEVSAMDRPGVLARIGLAMDQCGARLQGAKIATYGERVEDIFYISNEKNRPLNQTAEFDRLKKAIIERLSA